MYHALEIQEIFLQILSHFRGHSVDLASLAITCRTFKEPALDILWEELGNLSPLARCLPEISYQPSPVDPNRPKYAFRRPPTQNELDTLCSYTRRIRSLSLYDIDGLSRETIIMLFTTLGPLLPNLRYLRLNYYQHRTHLLLHPLPSLTFLDIELFDLLDDEQFHTSLHSVAKTSPDLKGLSIEIFELSGIVGDTIYPHFICQWRNLNTVACYEIFLDMNILVHLSRMPALTVLKFALSTTLPDQIALSEPPLIFSNIDDFRLSSVSLSSISSLLPKIRLPAITCFHVGIRSCPSRLDFSSFLASVQTSVEPRMILGFRDLHPCMAFGNLRIMEIDITWKVVLTDSELLMLASGWLRLERLGINEKWGWGTLGTLVVGHMLGEVTPCGITPNGLLQLLWTCRSLHNITLAMDTRGYTESPPSSAFLGLTFPSNFSINVVDSFIKTESVPAITAFFSGIASRSNLLLKAWKCLGKGDSLRPDTMSRVAKTHWDDVISRCPRARFLFTLLGM